MPIISTYCKKGGVGKTTFLGYLAHYYSQIGKKILVISADDQNSIFKLFGCESYVTEHDDDFLENLLAGTKNPEDVVFEARPGMYLMKTINTDELSLRLTLQRPLEKKLRATIEDFTNYFDYIFIDFPPSSSRLTEILLDMSENILIVVGLSALDLEGFTNTIQYFVDHDIKIDKISHIIPIGYHKIKVAPNKCLKEIKNMAKTYAPDAIVTAPINDKSEIKNLQGEGVSVFDEHMLKDKFHEKNRDSIRKELQEVYDTLNL